MASATSPNRARLCPWTRSPSATSWRQSRGLRGLTDSRWQPQERRAKGCRRRGGSSNSPRELAARHRRIAFPRVRCGDPPGARERATVPTSYPAIANTHLRSHATRATSSKKLPGKASTKVMSFACRVLLTTPPCEKTPSCAMACSVATERDRQRTTYRKL